MTDVVLTQPQAPPALSLDALTTFFIEHASADVLVEKDIRAQIVTVDSAVQVLDCMPEFAIFEVSSAGPPGPPGPPGLPGPVPPISALAPLIAPAVDAAIGNTFDLVAMYQLSN